MMRVRCTAAADTEKYEEIRSAGPRLPVVHANFGRQAALRLSRSQ